MRYHCILLAILLVIPLNTLQAENESSKRQTADQQVVVSATRLESEPQKVATAVTIISAEELQRKKIDTVAEALRSVSSADVVRSGGLGGNAAVFLRGANSEHTLVLIDGIEANNPISNNRSFNLADLRIANIERIEVLRGPQSTLYGSDAMGGVINIITKKGEGPPQVSAAAEAGSYNTFSEQAGVSGGDEIFDYSLFYTRVDSESISAADRALGNEENDPYSNDTFSTRLGYTASEQVSAQAFMRYYEAETEIDNFGGLGGDDPNREARNKALFTRGEINLSLLERAWRQSFGASFSHHKYADNNEPDELDPLTLLNSSFRGNLHKFDWLNYITASETLKLVLGAETEEESGDSTFLSDGFFGPFEDNFSERSATSNGYFAQAQVGDPDYFNSTFGVRLDDHSKFGSEVTYRLAPLLLLPQSGTKFSATLGTGFKAPSLYQLYSSYGDDNLEPEESLGLDAGIQQNLLDDSLEVGALFFYNKFENLITFEPNSLLFTNTADANSRGLESHVQLELLESVLLRANYSYTDTEDEETGLSLLRRARHKLAGSLEYVASDDLFFAFMLAYNGRRSDNDFSSFPASRTTLGGYTLVDLSVSYKLSKQIEIYSKVENVFDADYQEVFGFGAYGTAAYGGLRVKL